MKTVPPQSQGTLLNCALRFRKLALLALGIALPALLGSCVTQRTVRDSQGNIIYQEADLTSPFEDTEERLDEVRERERELGW